MATVPPKRSWANVAALPPKPNVILFVDSYYKGLGIDPSEDYIKKCVGQAKKQYYPMPLPIINNHNNEQIALRDQRNVFNHDWERFILDDMDDDYHRQYLVATFEEEMLMQMTNPANPDYIKMKSDFEWIAEKLSCNVIVFLGHVEQCVPYIEKKFKTLLEQQKSAPRYKTIFLIIACYGNNKAHMYNTDAAYKFFQDRNVAFFGFEDFMHFHAGEIYSCKKPLRKIINLICDYDGVEEDIKTILNGYKKPINSLNKENHLYKCCHARLEHIFKTFVEELYERQTTKYTKENLYEKFKLFATSADRSVLTEEYVNITASDGTSCENKQTCKIPNPYIKEEAIRKEFNKKSVLRNIYRELNTLLLSYLEVQRSHGDPLPKGEVFWKRIQNLVGDEQKIFTFEGGHNTESIIFEIINMNLHSNDKDLYTILSFIFEKYGHKFDFTVKSYANKTILEALYYSNLEQRQIYSLFKKLSDAIQDSNVRDTVFLGDGTKNSCFLSKKQYHLNPMIVKFYIQTFGPKLKDIPFYINSFMKGNLLHRCLIEYKNYLYGIHKEDLVLCIEGLLANGVDPNQETEADLEQKEKLATSYNMSVNDIADFPKVKPLEMHTTLFFPPYNEDLVKTFFKWGMNTKNNYLNTQINHWKPYTLPNTKQLFFSFQKVLSALNEYIINESNLDYNVNNNVFFEQSGGMSRSYNSYGRYNNNRYNYNYYNNYNNQEDSTYYYDQLNDSEKEIYEKHRKFLSEFRFVLHEVKQNIEKTIYLISGILENPDSTSQKEPFIRTVALFEDCKRIRKAASKHGSKFRRTRKRTKNALNKTIKRNLNAINIDLNPEGYVNKLLGEILELAKKPQFTREEKANFKSRPITIKKSNSNAKTKIAQLQSILDSMKQTLQSR